MSTIAPLTGLPAYTNSDPAYTGGSQIGGTLLGLEPYTVPRFASATARDTAWSNWLAAQPAGTKIPDGATCRLTSDDRLWRYDQTNLLWTWDMAAQGLIAQVSFSQTAVQGLADAPGTIAVFNITGITIPARRWVSLRLRVAGFTTVSGSYSMYGFDMFLNGVNTGHRITHSPVPNIARADNFVSYIQVGAALSNVGANVSGSLYSGSSYGLLADGAHGPAVFSVHDEGGY